MDETRLEDKLSELLKEFGDATDLQASKLAKLAEQAKANQKQIESNANRQQDLLDYLRVCIKYQAFDLEATRRENDYLRKLLEEDNR
ncbi:MAG: hypothetical protein A2167_00945 [Planctomycetes bacterium RBG_13_46_10]|nr:MAG: hypothetical protein A2167_00945 [Planctomycetes bacterium RBG_13_46_10]